MKRKHNSFFQKPINTSSLDNNEVLRTIIQCHSLPHVLNDIENSSHEKYENVITNNFYEHLYTFFLQLKTKGITEKTIDIIVEEVKIICEFLLVN